MVRVIVRATKSAMEKMHRKNFVIFSSAWCCKACLAVNFPCKSLLWGCSEDAPQTIPSGIENSFPSPVSRKMMAKRCQHTVGCKFVLHPISSMLSSWVWMFFWDGNAVAISGIFSYYCPCVCVGGGVRCDLVWEHCCYQHVSSLHEQGQQEPVSSPKEWAFHKLVLWS